MVLEYFSEQELRALPDMSDEDRFPLARVEAVAAEVVSTIEQTVGTSFVGRPVDDEVYDGGQGGVLLRSPYVLSVTSATADGVAVTDTLRVRAGGIVYRYATGALTPTAWPWGAGNLAVHYVAGYSEVPPSDIKAAALRATRALLLRDDSSSGIEDRETSMTADGTTITLSQAGEDRPFGFPSVDAVIVRWRNQLDVMGFS